MDETPCPVQVTLSVIGGKWKPVILWNIAQETVRFNQLHRQIGDITQKMLTQELRQLEHSGLVRREVFPESPPHVEYSLTPHGQSLWPVLQAMETWGTRHVDEIWNAN